MAEQQADCRVFARMVGQIAQYRDVPQQMQVEIRPDQPPDPLDGLDGEVMPGTRAVGGVGEEEPVGAVRG